MAKLNIPPTKSNLLMINEQLEVSKDGYELLDQKREILVMELMRMLDKIKILESDIQKKIDTAYPALRQMLLNVGGDTAKKIAQNVTYDFQLKEKKVNIAGKSFNTISVDLPKQKLFYSFLDSYGEIDKVIVEFLDLLRLLTEMASIRTIVWNLAKEVKKTQRRVNALDKMIIPQNEETKKYIEGVLEERERDNVFILKSLKKRIKI